MGIPGDLQLSYHVTAMTALSSFRPLNQQLRAIIRRSKGRSIDLVVFSNDTLNRVSGILLGGKLLRSAADRPSVRFEKVFLVTTGL